MLSKFSIVLFTILALSLTTCAQNAYYDAKTLSAHLDANHKFGPNSLSIFHKYYPGAADTAIANALIRNPFLSDIFDPTSAAALPNFLKGNNVLSSLSNLDVTNIADGLARFLIKRGKEELNIAFFEKMKEFLDDHIEAETLFPSTAALLGSIASYRYSELLQSLREAFYKDVTNLIVNLNLLIDLPKYQELLKALPEIRLAIRSAKIISSLSQPDSSLHPAILINHFAQLSEWGEMHVNLQSSWRVLDKISESVRRAEYTLHVTKSLKLDTVKLTRDTFTVKVVEVSDKLIRMDTTRMRANGMYRIDSVSTLKVDTIYDKDVAWIKFSDFNKDILKDTFALKIYLGLLYEKMEGISFRNRSNKDTSVQDFMKDNADDILKIADLVENFLLLANDVEQTLKDIEGRKANPTRDDYYTYIEKAINVVDYGFKVANVIEEGVTNDRYIVMARNANNLYKNIYTKNYNAAIMNAYLILREILQKPKEAIDEKTLTFDSFTTISPDTKKTFYSAQTRLSNSAFFSTDSINDRTKFVEGVLKYGNAIAGIVKAESPEEAEAAIEAAVLPAGSSSIKKNSAWNISLNAYIGGYFGKSFNSTDRIDGNNSKIGVTAPVGFAFSRGFQCKNGRSAGALSLYLTIIDVGAIAGYRLNDDSTALDQKVTLGDIFTPGGYLVYGIGIPVKWASYIPLSIGWGYQYGSKLYQKQDDGKLAISDESRWRSNWFVAIDIPLANFWTRGYKAKN